MARNEEKQLGRLNRLHLKHLHDEERKKNPKRPRLEDLQSSEDVKLWIPSIKKDIDFCLKQSQVPCYPETKIKEFNQKIHHLQGEYKAYVRKLRQLDPSITDIPWRNRRYKRVTKTLCKTEQFESTKEPDNQETLNDQLRLKAESIQFNDRSGDKGTASNDSHECEKLHEENTDKNISDSFIPISTPILEQEKRLENVYGYSEDKNIIDKNEVNLELQDKPLVFSSQQRKKFQDSSFKGDNYLHSLLPYSDSSDENG